MAKIFKYTFRHNLLSIPFLIAAAVVLAAGGHEAFIYIIDSDGLPFEHAYLMQEKTVYYLIFLFAGLSCLMTGREFANGTIRNKIVTGTSKTGYLMSHLLVNCLITVILTLLYFLPMFVFCAKYFNHFKPFFVFFSVLCVCLGFMMITVFATVLSVMIDRMVISLVISLALVFGFVMAYDWLGSQLSQPRYEENTEYNENGDIVYEYDVTNPVFVESKAARKVMWTVQHLLPCEIIENGTLIINSKLTSSSIYKRTREENKEYSYQYPHLYERSEALFYLPLYSTGMILFISALGLFLFKHRNLK